MFYSLLIKINHQADKRRGNYKEESHSESTSRQRPCGKKIMNPDLESVRTQHPTAEDQENILNWEHFSLHQRTPQKGLEKSNNREGSKQQRTTWQGFRTSHRREKKRKREQEKDMEKKHIQGEHEYRESPPSRSKHRSTPEEEVQRRKRPKKQDVNKGKDREEHLDIHKHHLEKKPTGARCKEGPQQTKLHDFQRRSYPHQEFHRKGMETPKPMAQTKLATEKPHREGHITQPI
ncbi:luc7-like protein 3 [Penaeus monodon]|uniref:luc7-like protein 3 n=1 Tax=Penaeus monodon TaxID=6687 RepID=UPI0018A7B636|nr:luc7-like protein 3 [Penaeus monodon]